MTGLCYTANFFSDLRARAPVPQKMLCIVTMALVHELQGENQRNMRFVMYGAIPVPGASAQPPDLDAILSRPLRLQFALAIVYFVGLA
jgi:hypothetical protein